MPNTTLDEKRAKIKYWLDMSGLSRQEVADKLGVHISSLNGWLSNKSLPEKRWLDIKAFFNADKEEPKETAPQGESFRAVALLFTSEQLAEIKALAGDVPVEEFIRESTLAMTRRILNKE